jgi:hypothetical protein
LAARSSEVDVAGGCDGGRVIIDGAVKDERSVKTVNAFTFCLDQSR